MRVSTVRRGLNFTIELYTLYSEQDITAHWVPDIPSSTHVQLDHGPILQTYANKVTATSVPKDGTVLKVLPRLLGSVCQAITARPVCSWSM